MKSAPGRAVRDRRERYDQHHQAEDGDGAELPLFLQVEDHDRHYLVQRREQDDNPSTLASSSSPCAFGAVLEFEYLSIFI